MSIPSDAELKAIVRRVVQHTLGAQVESEDVRKTRHTQISAPKSSIPQPSEPVSATSQAVAPASPAGPTIALSADHGGFELKETLKAFLIEKGYNVVDCGTHSTHSVDYPDFAFAVARLVSSGEAWRGVIVDGAGIGSCMTANKVPGVRAAMCYDHATALNSREHNDANVLTLGAGLVGKNLARQILETWLNTAFGGGRHGRRVEKIVAIENRYIKHRS